MLSPIVILGPTAGGKSELAVALGQRLNGEILGADSMQVYRRLDAGTAKPEPELRAAVPHHLIDIVEPTERFTAADWLALAEELIARLQQAGKRPIVVGGTNLYLKLLLEGMFEGPPQDDAFRASLDDVPNETLHERLAKVDSAAAERLHRNDRKRIVRALEVHHLTGKTISEQQQQWGGKFKVQSSKFKVRLAAERSGARGVNPAHAKACKAYRHDPILVGLDWPVAAINRRINARVKAMFEPPPPEPPPPDPEGASRGVSPGDWPGESLPDEVRRLESAGVLGPQAREALGYKQVLDGLAGRCTMAEAFERTKILTRRFAKQQRTWLRRYQGVHWLPMAEMTLEGAAEAAERVTR